MRLTFQLRFHTHYGQTLFLSGAHPVFGNSNVEQAIPLQYLNDQSWQVTIPIPDSARPEVEIVYHYVLRNSDGSLRFDWGSDKTINPAALKADEVLIVDAWNDAGFIENAFYTGPFRQVLLRGNATD